MFEKFFKPGYVQDGFGYDFISSHLVSIIYNIK